jgi:EAL domain-containing protein (putative c-di-GMP-specific phosphodiesterase class I)
MLLYQQKINLETGTISGVEALIRRQNQQRGLILPKTFLGIAEDCGLIVALGIWVLRAPPASKRRPDRIEACRRHR